MKYFIVNMNLWTFIIQKKIKIYQNIFLSLLNKNDCVNSMDIFDDILIYRTIMGIVNLCRVDKNNLKSKRKK